MLLGCGVPGVLGAGLVRTLGVEKPWNEGGGGGGGGGGGCACARLQVRGFEGTLIITPCLCFCPAQLKQATKQPSPCLASLIKLPQTCGFFPVFVPVFVLYAVFVRCCVPGGVWLPGVSGKGRSVPLKAGAGGGGGGPGGGGLRGVVVKDGGLVVSSTKRRVVSYSMRQNVFVIHAAETLVLIACSDNAHSVKTH